MEVGGRCLPFHVRACCQNDFAIRLPGDAFHQGLNVEVFRLHIIQRGKLAAQAVVQSAVGAAAFNGDDVRGLFHHADEAAVPFFIPAGGAGLPSVLKKPQTGQGVTCSAAWPMVRAIVSASPMCPWSIHRAMRSAPRVPMPGSCFRAVTSSSTGMG